MKKSKRLSKIASLIGGQERQAAEVVGEVQKVVNERSARFNELESYRDEYISSFQSKVGGTLNVTQLNDYRAFTVRLNSAVEQQRQLLKQSQAILEEKKRVWFEIRNKYQSIEKVAEKSRDVEQLNENRQEQKEADSRSCTSKRWECI